MTASDQPAERTITISPPTPAPIGDLEKLASSIEWKRREVEEMVIAIYRVIDGTPPDEDVNRYIAEAYQRLHAASEALNAARRAAVLGAMIETGKPAHVIG
jgi:hypothetical protein